jgi:hypothetical protein
MPIYIVYLTYKKLSNRKEIKMIRDLINEFGWVLSLFVFALVNFAAVWWTLEILHFLQKNW